MTSTADSTASFDPRGDQSAPPRRGFNWLLLGFTFPILLIILSVLSVWSETPTVSLTLQFAAAITVACLAALILAHRRNPETLSIVFVPLAPHYIQALMHTSIYVYWGWYWRPVYDHVWLIVAQILFAYSLDMILGLIRRKMWIVGFGPLPIILSTNLFLLFKPEWFYLQFLMIAVGILGKEFVRWERDGKNVHIFNPSAFSLFIFSIALIATDSTDISFAREIATTLNHAPHIFLQIFILGLIVQYLFSVTLVTLMSALALVILNLVYTEITGVYFFFDSNIPIAVFLGLHLLITDPATSPRTSLGKAMFGLMYGGSVFFLFAVLGWLGAPTFYDKLLCVPLLNLLVPTLDSFARRFSDRLKPSSTNAYSEVSPQSNRLHMAIWCTVFIVMFSTSFVGQDHPGSQISYWDSACEKDLRNACQTAYDMKRNFCAAGNPAHCVGADDVLKQHPEVADTLKQGHLLSRGCDLGLGEACNRFRDYITTNGTTELDIACQDNDFDSCLILGLVHMFGMGIPASPQAAMPFWENACVGNISRACAYLGEMHLLGRDINPDAERAAYYLDAACNLGSDGGCTTLGLMYRRGHGVPRDAARADQLIQNACSAGWDLACKNLND